MSSENMKHSPNVSANMKHFLNAPPPPSKHKTFTQCPQQTLDIHPMFAESTKHLSNVPSKHETFTQCAQQTQYIYPMSPANTRHSPNGPANTTLSPDVRAHMKHSPNVQANTRVTFTQCPQQTQDIHPCSQQP